MARAALITGSGRRIGRALALALANAGHDVALHYHRSSHEAEELASAIESLGRRVVLLPADLGAAHEASSLVARALEALGPLTLLVNNASVFVDDRVGSLTASAFDDHMAVNLRAPVFLAQAFAAQAPDGDALVVNILDQRVLHPNPQFFSYGLSKSALATATLTLAQALAPRVRVNAIAPGPTLPSIHQAPDDFAAEAAGIPLQRPVAAAEIAAALLYLVDAPSVTGQIIAVDGGQHLAWRTPDIVSP